MEQKGKIYEINGPVVTIEGSDKFEMLERVLVGNMQLTGEVIGITGDRAIVQVYEVTTGLKIGEPVYTTGMPLSLQLGPGIVGEVFDGIQRPLEYIAKKTGAFIGRGLQVEALDPEKKWETKILVKVGEEVKAGDTIAEVQETSLILHKVMLPPGKKGKVLSITNDGQYTIKDTIVTIEDDNGRKEDLTLVQYWPVRKPRPFDERKRMEMPLITGQRVIDTFFPIAKGGTAAIPGGFGTGKTMTQHQLAKWSDADLIVYIGCGERGNEITDVLEEFPKLIDPKSGKSLMERTVLIANTSNMPVAAREASIYTGITLAEYYRDMGYHVAIMADSTSRWAEALREISGRLEEMPAEEGFPAYLPSRLSQFYERAGYVENLNGTEGSVSIIGAVSPQGGDFSEPVTQNTKRFVRCFWALDRQLAYARHYPAINWLDSYTEYMDDLSSWYDEKISGEFLDLRKEMMGLLQEESSLMEIVKLIGADVLPEGQKLTLEITKTIRLGFLQQNAFHDIDTFVPLEKQYYMLKLIHQLKEKTREVIKKDIPVSQIRKTGIFEKLINIKYTVGNDDMSQFDEYFAAIDKECDSLIDSYRLFERKKQS
ncbi:V-type ATP synthase subunit A [Vallitalea okinawensis]|uniref:V-type ATP synthase subunit A n=1 Tax=Vallitalea okinawensis TaxID=2078660 RepID=UPI000CFDBFC4|nr:V-type ATP synthase subunit A [Vallitalea okinawensis]